jgi:hypothetical protein
MFEGYFELKLGPVLKSRNERNEPDNDIAETLLSPIIFSIRIESQRIDTYSPRLTKYLREPLFMITPGVFPAISN